MLVNSIKDTVDHVPPYEKQSLLDCRDRYTSTTHNLSVKRGVSRE